MLSCPYPTRRRLTNRTDADTFLNQKPKNTRGQMETGLEQGNRAAIYLRVSTDAQTCANQRPEVVALAKARGLKVVKVYEEKASSVGSRPVWDKCWAAAHDGEFDHLLVWSLDRLHRSLLGAVNSVVELDRIGVRVVSVREQWLDSAGPARGLLVAVFGWLGEQERRRLVERTRAGLERARREGKRLGRPPAVIDLEKARTLRSQGLALREVARQLGVGSATLHRALRDVSETGANPDAITP